MSIWSWVGKRGEARGGTQQVGAPILEQLEPRLLLSVDSLGGQYPISYQTPCDEQALVVNLNGEGTGSQASGSYSIATLPVSSDQASLTGQPDTSSQPEVSDLGLVGQGDPAESEAGPTTDLNLQAPSDSIVVLDGTAGQVLSDTPEAYAERQNPADEPVTVQAPADAAPRGPPAVGESSISQIVFVDSAVDPDFQVKNAGLSGVAVVLLDTGRDGIRQITDILSAYRDLSAIHIISHGAPGQVTFGAATLSLSSLNSYADDLAAWGKSLAQEGDILLYGCGVGTGREGEALTQELAALTGADVAASNDPTGLAELGGDWILETATGPIEASWANAETVVAIHGLLAAGDLDTTFGSAGKVVTPIGAYEDRGNAVAIQIDGKILVAGYSDSRTDLGSSNYDFALVRYNADGSLDASFGVLGIVTTAIGPGHDQARSLTLQPDGKILVAGTSENGSNSDFAVVRYNTDGSLDTSFGVGGKVSTDLESSSDYAYGVAIQSDGKIVVTGSRSKSPAYDFAVVRYNSDGSLDTSFGGDGKVITDVAGSTDKGIGGVVLQPDGKIVVAGSANNGSDDDVAVVRYNTDGSLDTSFDGDGKVTTAIGSATDVGYSVALQSDGKIVVGGVSSSDFAVVRYNTDGSLDTSFDGDGKVTTAVGPGSDTGYSVALQPDGKIVVAGSASNGSNSDFALVRYNADGSLDTSFGTSGKVMTAIGSSTDYSQGVAIQADGKIVAAGLTSTGSSNDLAVVRYLNDVTTPVEITVLGNGISIADGDTTPSTADGTDFQLVAQGGAPISRVFTVYNASSSTLTLGTVTVPAGFTLAEGLPASLAAGASDTFTVQLDTASVGTKAGDISFETNDSDENPFHFQITGTVWSASEVTVLGNGVSISDGDATPGTTDGTDFGFAAPGLAVASRTFTVRNDGTEPLVLGAATVPAGYTLMEGLSTSLAPGESDTFTIRLDMAIAGTKAGDVSFCVNDADENPFNFRITGTVLAPGDLDPTFGTGGIAHAGFPTIEEPCSVPIQPDGKIVLAGYTYVTGNGQDFSVVRYNVDGTLDTSFSGDGWVTTRLTANEDKARSAAIQSDGKIVVAGHSYVTVSGNDFSVVRYNVDGSLDTSFSTDGMVTTAVGMMDDAWAVAIQFDDKIVVAGWTSTSSGTGDIALVRYNADGSLDTSFGVGGKVTTDVGVLSNDAAYSMVLQPDGKIVVAGVSGGDFALVRYNPDGSLDTSFDGDGKVTTDFGSTNGESARSVALQPDGKIVVAGSINNSSQSDFAVARYNADGSLDTSFSGDGKVTTDLLGSSTDNGYSVAIQSDGKIVAAGSMYRYDSIGYDLALVRYNADGALDTSFSAGGKLIADFGTSEIGYGVAFQPDGRIVVAGLLKGGYGVARYISGVVAPEITVASDGFVLADGDTAPRTADGTDFGLATQGGVPTSRVFTVRNDGTAVLTLGAVIVPAGFTVTEGLSTSLAPGASDTFTIQLDTVTPGIKAGEVSFVTNDSDENPFNFTITGFVQPSSPEITVLGNDIVITDGDTTPSASDGTDFGTVAWGQAPVSHTFTVRNNGSEVLTLGTMSVPAGYTVTEGLSASLAPEESDTFTVRLDTTMGGVKTDDVSFSTNDADENPFNFRITGTVTAGSLDPTFGTGGIVTTDIGTSTTDSGRAVAIQPDGKIVVAGYADDYFSASRYDFAVVRYNADGSLDTSFGVGGKVTTDFASTSDYAYGVALQSDGKIVVSGYSGTDFAVVRYNVDGSLDTSLGTGGKITTEVAGTDYGFGVALQSDGKIVVGGTAGGDFALVRYNTDGSLDTSFDGDGKVITPVGSAYDHGFSVVVQFDGKLVLAGYTNTGAAADFALVRYNADGSLDTSFGVGGKATTDLNGDADYGFSVALQSDGKLVVAGYSYRTGIGTYFALVRYNADGSLDTSFGVGGKVTTNVIGDYDNGCGVAIQFGGKIVVVGARVSAAYHDSVLVQFNADGSLDTSFGTGGMIVTPISGGDDMGYSVALQSDGKIVMAGESIYNFALVRYNGGVTTPAEITVFGNGVSITDGDATPDTADGTDFGSVPQGGAPFSRVFTVCNVGGSTLTLGTPTVPVGFTLAEGLSSSLASGASDTFTVQLDTATPGIKSGEISFSNDDSDENPFTFAISGTVEAPAPEITVLGDDTVIADGDATPGTADGTDFGSVAQEGSAISRIFTVRNDGSEVLTLGMVTVPTDYTLTEALVSSLDPGTLDTFTVQLETTTPGIKSGEITFSNSDDDENPFHFAITGRVLALPEVTVLGNGISIANGDTTPDPADNTDFGSVLQGAWPVSRTFTVRNDGELTLMLGAVTLPAGFTLTTSLSPTLAAGASDTFTVQLDTATVGTKTGDISFSTNDSDENPFNFRITGTVLPAPEITVLGNGISITDGDTTPGTEDGTDFGYVLQGEAAVSHTFTVRNDGTATLTLGTVTIPAGYTVTEDLSASLTPGESDTFTIQLDTAAVGTKAGNVSFSNNDLDENSFNFQITGAVIGTGDLDPTFGTGGMVKLSGGWGRSVALQSDGKIVVAGDYGDQFTVVRYDSDGSRDTSFGIDGKVTTPFSVWFDYGQSVAIQSDGKIVAAGYTTAGTGDFAVARYNTDGSLDTSFDGDGMVITGIGSGGDAGYSVALQSDGKIVVAGASASGTSSTNFALVRYNTNGSLDTLFDGDGKVVTAVGASSAGYGVALQSDGKIVVAGYSLIGSQEDFALVRYNADGSLDASFGVGGQVTTDLASSGDWARSVALQPDGKIVVAGYKEYDGSYDFAVVRYGTDGALDTSFGVGGKVITDTGTWRDLGYSVALQSDGKIVVGGLSSNGDFALLRYNANGVLDTSFSVDGMAFVDSLGNGYDVAIQSDGKILLAGGSFSVARYLGDAPANAEISTMGDGVSIGDGDTTPSTADGTDFGSMSQYDPAISRMFTVRNDGGSTLTLGAVTVPAGFTVTEGLATSLAPGAEDTFTVRLDTTAAGMKTGDVSFSTNDYDENPFNFRITGMVVGVGNLALSRPAIASTSYTGMPASNATDGNMSSRWSSQFSDNEWIYVDLGLVYRINRVVLQWESAYGRGYKLQVSNDASTWSDVYSTTTGDGGVDDITLASPAYGRYLRMLGTQRATAYGYSLYELEVYGGAPAPEITVLGNGVTIADGDAMPGATDATDFGSVAQGEAAVSRTFTVRNDGGSTLTLGAVTVPTGFTLAEELVSSLDPGALDTFTVQLDTATPGTSSGEIIFSNNDPDENPFNFAITGTVLAPAEITVLGNGVVIADGDATPDAADDTDFGSVLQGTAGISRTFTVRNDGESTLTLGEVTVPTGFTVTEGLSASLAAGASDTFTVRLDTASVGTKAGEISFATNDSDENPFNFQITGTILPAPEITVLGSDVPIADGDTTPSAADGTDFGSMVQGEAALSRMFMVRNDGTDTLTLGSVAIPAGYTLTEDLSTSLAAGESDTFTVQLDTATIGTYAGEISFSTNDSDENPFNFTITGTVAALVVPEVTVTVAPSAVFEDGTANLVYTFTRSVADASPLTVSFTVGGTAVFEMDYTQSGAAVFSTTAGTIVIGANETTATVTVDPTADTTVEADETVILTVTAGAGYTVGTPSASTGTIQNDDGLGNLASGRPATASTSYSGLPASNATDGNTSSRWSSQFSDNEWIYVDLGAVYTINHVVLRWEAAYGRGYKLQVSGNAGSWSDVYTTTAGDGGVDDITLSAPASGRYVRMLGTQRATLYGYSLWEFEVYGGGATNHAPAVSSFSKSLMQDTALPFAVADFAAAFTDPDASDSLQKIKITSLPSQGVLTLSSTAVTLNQEITTAQIGTLVYTPTSSYTGSDSFQWNGSDGSLYAATEAAVNLSITAAAANLALGKTAVASTSYSGLPASNATDGNVNSRWSSQFSDSEWIYVDLGSVYAIDRVVLRWQTAYGQSYKLQVSSDASSWSDVYSTTSGDGGVDDSTLAAPASGRYVRMLGVQRATAWGYSLYEFEVYGGAAGPEVTVLGNGVSIANGDASPSTADGTSFGSVVQGGPAVSRTFTVRNDGGAALTLGTVTVPAGFTLTEGLSSNLAPGASDTFTVQLDTATVGTQSGEISFATDDSDENPFTFQITGVVALPGEAEVTVTVAPSAVAEDGSTSLVYTFTRSVADSSPLTVSFSVGGTATFATDYTPSGAVSFDAVSGTVTIAASQTTAAVTIDPTVDTTLEPDETVILTVTTGTGYTVGTPSASTGTIQNDDGSGNLALGRPATTSTSYSGLPASNATDGNMSSRWSSQFADSEWIYVDLGSAYTINRVVLRWEAAYGRGYKIQVSSDASSWSDVYTTTAGDGGVDDLTLAAPAAGRYVRMLGTQRATAYGYSLYELEVYAGTVAPNLALGKTAAASTSYSGLPASNATDGNLSSRWSSQFSDSEWIYVDLGAVFTIDQVILRWETAYGRGYRIQISNDASTWSDVYSTTTGDGGVDEITLSAPASGRYVRLLGTQRATAYGYSLWEFEVYT